MSGFARLFLRVAVTNLRIAQHRRPVFSSTANTGSHKPTRNFKLTPDKETLIDVLVKSGRYGDASEVVREGCGSSKLARRRTQPDWGALRAAVDVGVAAMERGEYKEFESAADLVAHLRRLSGAVMTLGLDPR